MKSRGSSPSSAMVRSYSVSQSHGGVAAAVVSPTGAGTISAGTAASTLTAMPATRSRRTVVPQTIAVA
ncbi:hypothetical protein ABZ863_30855 [Saccharomonospora sp. NPDC046836]|uniref:hypothetical protein n=1 Tax=Saccharomonospora sp. NPDC046836 TaxID=3156921 RepID=UPI0033D68ED0